VAARLPDGWGEDTPRGDSLIRAYAEAWADLAEILGRAGGHRTVRSNDFVAFDSGAPFPFVNAAVLLRPVHDPDDPVLDEITAFFATDAGDTPFLVWSATPTPSLTARGWNLMGHPPLMLRPAGPADVPTPEGIEIVPVRDPETLAAFDTTLIEAYPVPEMRGRRHFGNDVMDAPGWHMWLAMADGRPIGTAAAQVTETIVDVEWISLRPEHRGKRVGEALTWAATLAEPTLPAMLFASDLGRPTYERMGYVTLTRLTLWVGRRAQESGAQ
jgi:GNAT superfamily N-acetyltransferase